MVIELCEFTQEEKEKKREEEKEKTRRNKGHRNSF